MEDGFRRLAEWLAEYSIPIGVAGSIASVVGIIIAWWIFRTQTRQAKQQGRVLDNLGALQSADTKRAERQAEVLDRLVSMQGQLQGLAESIDRKVLGALGSVSQVTEAVVTLIRDSNADCSDLYGMAYWTWFGCDHEVAAPDDIDKLTADSSLCHQALGERLGVAGSGMLKLLVLPPASSGTARFLDALFVDWRFPDKDPDALKAKTSALRARYEKALMTLETAGKRSGGRSDIRTGERLPLIMFAKWLPQPRAVVWFVEVDQLASGSPAMGGFSTWDPALVTVVIQQINSLHAGAPKVE